MADKKVYRYPYTLIAESTDYLQIDVVNYVPISKAEVNNKSLTSKAGSRRNQGKKNSKTILLPIP